MRLNASASVSEREITSTWPSPEAKGEGLLGAHLVEVLEAAESVAVESAVAERLLA